MPAQLLKRSEVPITDTWKLEDIFASNEDWEKGLAALKELLPRLEQYKGKLHEREQLLKALDASTQAGRLAGSLYVYAKMRRDEDNANTLYQGMVARISAAEAELGQCTSYIKPELMLLSDEELKRFQADGAFSDYSAELEELIRHRPHTLSAREEMLIALSRGTANACGNVYDMLTDADMRFPEIRDEQDQAVRLTHSNYIPFMMNRDRRVRREAFEALYNTYNSFGSTIPAIYAGSVKSDVFYAKARGFESAREASLFGDNIPLSVYDNLISAINESLPLLQKFVGINARLNGIKDMHFYDLYLAPSLGFDINLPFDEAYELVIDCLKVLGEDYTQVLRRALKERWIDKFENEGKSSGAYSWGTYDSHPYVLINYKEDLDHLQTIAHEMGHSLHTWYSNTTQPYTKSSYSLFVAEVASTVNEVLVLMELMDRYPQPEAQAYLLYNLLDSIRGTIFRQTMFAEFEKNAHAMEEKGEALTNETLSGMYAKLNQKYYANLCFDELISYEWMRIPHFYNAFYVYKYATGFSAALAIAGMIRQEGAPAVERYKRFLKAGCSLYPLEALKLAGVDLSSPEPVRAAMQQFAQLLERYEQVTKQLKTE